MKSRKQMTQLEVHAGIMGRLFIEMYRQQIIEELKIEKNKSWYKKLGRMWFNIKLRIKRGMHR